MMETYRGEKILSELSARIHPADKNIPDCRCILALSDNHLFVIEDNFDGSFTDHYIIEIKFIEDIRISEGEEGKADFKPVSGRIHRIKRPKKYLEVIYNDDNFVKQHLFFDEWDVSPKQFVKTFKG